MKKTVKRFTRRLFLLALAGGLLVVPARAATPASAVEDGQLERSILAEINVVRHAHGLPAVRASIQLGRAATGHSHAMADYGFFAHESRDGTPFWKRIRRSYPATGFRSWSVGENLLWSSGSVDAKAAVTTWLRSPGHRRILLTASWRDVGISAVAATHAPGEFDGLDVTLVTADFGFRH